MSTSSEACLHNLPVELLDHLLHLLDSSTILLSFRYVCQRFYQLTEIYNRYQIDFHASSKREFYRISRILQPVNVLRLNLSDDQHTPGQIALFLRSFRLNQFSSLRSLTLLEIADDNLNLILQDFSLPHLQSLTIQSRPLFTWTTSTLTSLTTILQSSSLQHLTLSIWCFEIHDFLWPTSCSIRSLIISSRITFEQYCTILNRCFALEILQIKDVLWNDPEVLVSTAYPQLISLTLDDNRMDISRLEQFLSLTPSLTHFKVIGMAYLNDTYSWEKILQTKLPKLTRFEFFFLSWKNVNDEFTDVQTLIQPYQTPFWLQTKQWTVMCDYILQPTEVMLYSLPICKNLFHYHHSSNKISCSNKKKSNGSNLPSTMTMMISAGTNQITKLRLNLVKILSQTEQFDFSTPLFPAVRTLILDLDEKCSIKIHLFLSPLISLSSIIDVQLNLNYDFSRDRPTMDSLIELFRHTSHLERLDICNNLSSIHSTTTIEDICSIIPSSIRHLKITVKNLNEMKLIFDQLNYLSSIHFQFANVKSIPSTKIIESFLNIQKDLTYRKDDCSIQVWLNT